MSEERVDAMSKLLAKAGRPLAGAAKPMFEVFFDAIEATLVAVDRLWPEFDEHDRARPRDASPDDEAE